MKIQEQVALAPLTTMKVGGPARYFVEAETSEDIREAIAFARSRNLPFFVLGGGSNLVVADAGFDGVVVKTALCGIKEIGPNLPIAGRYGAPAVADAEDHLIFEVGAGQDWDNFVAHAVERDCAGLECLSGIPGTVGATPVQNVGAYGQEVAETIISVKALEIESGRECEFTNAECGFAYRTSRFNTVDRGRFVILGVTFALRPSGAPKIAYGDLKKCFAQNARPALAEVRDAVLAVRRGKGMVVANDDPDSRSAGSFFKNPVLSEEQFRDLEQRASARGLTIPSYPALASQHKVSAAWLIEQAGFPRGYAKGPVGISTKHTLAIVNRGGAKAADVVGLKDEIQRGVEDQFGIELQPEPVFLGF